MKGGGGADSVECSNFRHNYKLTLNPFTQKAYVKIWLHYASNRREVILEDDRTFGSDIPSSLSYNSQQVHFSYLCLSISFLCQRLFSGIKVDLYGYTVTRP
jgi:hypothetical protein